MPLRLIPLLTVLFFMPLSAMAQDDLRYDLMLKSGAIVPEKNITAEKIMQFNKTADKGYGKTFVVIQFEKIPTEKEKQQLLASGIQLLDYIPNNAYTATVTGSIDITVLQQAKARSVVELTALQKMEPRLGNGDFPARAVKVGGTVDVLISFPGSFSFEEVNNELRTRNFDIISSVYKTYRIIALRVGVQRLGELALLPFIEYVQAVPGSDQPLSPFWTNWGRDGVRGTILGAPISAGGKNLKGSGVVIGIGDNADPQLHVDFTNRLINRAATDYYLHGTHVTGIAGGAGIINEVRTGLAPKSTIITQLFGNILTNAPAYVADHGMVITNNSYGNNEEECATFGVYDLYSRILDQQAIDLPNLQNVFAAGNSGDDGCHLFVDSFRTVLGGYQSAKNAISVGNFTPIGFLFTGSSRGPTRDGRIKPEILAIGSFIESTSPPPYDYIENSGTSMASPAIAGGLALLYEKYRLLHTGQDPKNGLMKALVCNSGDDWGMPGPDYSHGFGIANFWRAENMLEAGNYFAGTMATAGSPQTIPITVPPGTGELKVMLYWNDPAAAVLASYTLVNDLDLEVVTPAPVTTVLPFILDTTYNGVKLAATTGVDHINNIEQVVIKDPAAGTYNINVKQTAITQNSPQEYFVVYDYVPLETKLVTPGGGEPYLQGENVIARWDSYGSPDNQFTLEFSSNNGGSWTTLKNNIAADKRTYFYTAPDPNEWFIVPQVTTDEALIRVSRNGTGISSTSPKFVICDTIFASLSATQCEGYFSIDWTAVPGATGYEVMMLRGDEMVHVANVSNSTFTYTIGGLSKDSVYWVSVRPLIGASNSPGRRAIAVSRKPDSGTCIGVISDKDIKIDSVRSPVRSGRILTSTSLGSAVPVTVRIKNLDDVATPGNIDVTYILNGGSPVTHTINPGIAGGDTLSYTFPETINMSAVGTYTLDVSISQSGDPVTQNNSVTKVYKQLTNPAIGLVTTFVDNFDLAAAQSYNTPQLGLQDLDRYDFVSSNDKGRARTFVNTGIALSGNRAITLDASILNAGTIDSLTGTYNLAAFNISLPDIRLDFQYKNHGQDSDPADKVWIRGADDQNWILAYDLDANQNEADGSYKKTSSIELTDLLQNAGQSFSSSSQIRWGQYGQQQATDNDGAAGYTFDDIRLYKVTDDMQMVSIDGPVTASCGLGVSTPVTIKVRNSSNAPVTNVPVRYKVDGGSFSPYENIPLIGANATSLPFTFTQTADLSGYGTHLIQVEVDHPTDSYFENDTMSVRINNSPLVAVTNSTPYLENFESGSGSWYASGKNNSWEYGTPASFQIKRAASGSKAWKTRILGNYNDAERSYLYSPCFDVSTMTAPALSFSVALDLEDCGGGLCDGAYVEYSVDGTNWSRLGAAGQGTNWYNKSYSGNNLWSVQNYTRWHVATIPLSVIPGPTASLTQLRFRFVVSSDPAVNRDGIAVDDIHIYSNPNGIYDGVTMGSSVNANIPGTPGWVDFLSGGKLVASVNSPTLITPMGSTDVQAYINTGGIRINAQQYYHNRNITIKPTTVDLADSATVRFYFLDTETEALINASGCGNCFKPSMAYELGVTKYSDADDTKENGTLSDNVSGTYSFINSAKTKIVPFDKGYYAEFKVKNFSEFWLNNGGLDLITPLPLKLVSFTARKKNIKDALLEWTTVTELNVNRFEIEVARGNSDYQLGHFTKLGEIMSHGNSTSQQNYSFTDIENNKLGIRYYRLKMIDNDGTFTYSPIRPVVFNNDLQWQVYPNPSAGTFDLIYQFTDGETIAAKVYDVNGKAVKQYSSQATGFVQKLTIDLEEKVFASGLYLLEVTAGGKKQTFRLLKQ